MAASDPFDFSRFFGGNMGFGMPGIVTPTLDVDELDKKIKDLKAVEGWLSMNLSMLQMSIQGLEVQRSTLASLKAMGEAFNQSMSEASQAAKENAKASEAAANTPPPETTSDASTDQSSAHPAGMWPWDFAAQAMASLQQQMQEAAAQQPVTENDAPSPATEATSPKKASRAPRKAKPQA